MPPRPDTYYGVGKVATEALGSLYHDRYGMQVAALRIGTFRDRPVSRRHLSTWLSPDDLCRLVDAMLRAPDLGFAVVYGISANTRRWWDLEPGRGARVPPAGRRRDVRRAGAGRDPRPGGRRPGRGVPRWCSRGPGRRPVGTDRRCPGWRRPWSPGAPAVVQPVAPASGDLFARARAWVAEDPDGDTRIELEALLVGDEIEELADRFDGRLEFGTAGLRGRLGAGPNRMNRAVVIRAAAGLGAYLLEHGGGAVVVGYDARHKSDVFARDTAEVASGLGPAGDGAAAARCRRRCWRTRSARWAALPG